MYCFIYLIQTYPLYINNGQTFFEIEAVSLKLHSKGYRPLIKMLCKSQAELKIDAVKV